MKGVSLAEQIANFIENYGAFGVVGVCIGFLLIVFLIFTQQIRLDLDTLCAYSVGIRCTLPEFLLVAAAVVAFPRFSVRIWRYSL